jgi:NAD(P)-dependent dehydrogenase (short-subunit alcohol dehydrogenase family)
VDIRLDGKVALVTGGSKGIGRAIAAELARSGAKVMISSRKEAALKEAAESMVGDVGWFAAHAGRAEDVEACVTATVERFGAVDILVNNAATNPYAGPLMDLDVGRAVKTIEVNLLGPLLWVQNCWRAWMAEASGVVINISSIGGVRGARSPIAWYSMTKAGLIHLTQTMAAELGAHVRVNAICPGVVKTDMARMLWEGDEEGVARAYPLRRLGMPEDIAGLATFLTSDEAAWITGSTFVVDGGALVGGSR